MLFLLNLTSSAQNETNILDWKSDASLRTYLLLKMHDQYDQRRVAVDYALTSKASMEQYKNRCREKYIKLLGDFPENTPLNTTITRHSQLKGYSVENVYFESRPAHHVTANLYIPDGKGPFPAVLFFMGHEMTSKATESYQKTAILFATNGFVVLAVDPVSQGERVQFTDSAGVRILRGSTTEHTLLNAGANLIGGSIVAWELYDNVRALDYLASRSEVDADRIGCLGNSGGGTQTAYFIAFDNRIKVAAPCSFISRRERNFELTGSADGCQHLPFEGREQLEIGDFLIMFAPKPLLILAGRYDFVDYRGTMETFSELQSVYSLYGKKDRACMFTYNDGHGISKPKREAAVNWFSLWLKGKDENVSEGVITVEDEKELNCTSTGQVNSFFKGEKDVQDFTLQQAVDLSSQRNDFLEKTTFARTQEKVKELLSAGSNEFTVTAEIKGVEHKQAYFIQKLILRRGDEVPMPCLAYIPETFGRNDTVVVWLNEKGKSEIAYDNEQLSGYLNAGNPVFIADLRGMGETAEKQDANESKYYNREYHNAMLALHIGSPLPGQRTDDILALIKYISQQTGMKDRPVKIIATGAAVQPALYAGVLNRAIVAIEASSTIRSYFGILEKPMGKDWYSYVVPAVLRYFDIPDIERMRPEMRVRYK
jgi:hypothetical protein